MEVKHMQGGMYVYVHACAENKHLEQFNYYHAKSGQQFTCNCLAVTDTLCNSSAARFHQI